MEERTFLLAMDYVESRERCKRDGGRISAEKSTHDAIQKIPIRDLKDDWRRGKGRTPYDGLTPIIGGGHDAQ